MDSKRDQTLYSKSDDLPVSLLRLSQVLAPLGPIPVSRSTWWAGVKSGRYPRPVRLGRRIVAWRSDAILALAQHGVAG